MTNNVTEESFQFFRTKKSFFIFGVPQIDIFVKELPKLNLTIGPKESPKIADHLGFTVQHLVEQ
jgi:hypothetical protein